MELAIVMPNVLMTSNSSTEKPTPMIGMMTKVTMEAVALNSMFGKPTSGQMLSQPIPAKLLATIDVRKTNAEMEAKDKTEFVTKMAVI